MLNFHINRAGKNLLPLGPNQRWLLDFVHDQMTEGRR
jgi:hypothetical protein